MAIWHCPMHWIGLAHAGPVPGRQAQSSACLGQCQDGRPDQACTGLALRPGLGPNLACIGQDRTGVFRVGIRTKSSMCRAGAGAWSGTSRAGVSFFLDTAGEKGLIWWMQNWSQGWEHALNHTYSLTPQWIIPLPQPPPPHSVTFTSNPQVIWVLKQLMRKLCSVIRKPLSP